MRLLGAVRLSVDTDASTSVERQTEKIHAYAKAKGHQVIAIAEDTDVSGKIPPHERPSLGPWLKRKDEWDGLIVAKADRLSRSLRDFLNLMHDLQAAGKQVICLDPELDMTTPSGRLAANVLLSFAEFEREMISGRVKEATAFIQSSGGYSGGWTPFGYRPVQKDRGWTYEPDPVYAPVVTEIVERFLGGASYNSIARWLTERGIPTSRDAQRIRNGKPSEGESWKVNSLQKVLLSPAIAGLAVKDREPVRDSEGMYVRRCEGIVSVETWQKVVALAEANKIHHKPRSNTSLLRQVLFCSGCGAPMYGTQSSKYGYYRCDNSGKPAKPCKLPLIRQDKVEAIIVSVLMREVGEVELREKIITPAMNTDAALAEIQSNLDQLQEQLVAGRISADLFVSTAEKLEARQTALRATQTDSETVAYRSLGLTFSERWEALDDAGRNAFLLASGISVFAEKTDFDLMPWPDPEGKVVMVVGDGLRVVIHLGDMAELRDMAANS